MSLAMSAAPFDTSDNNYNSYNSDTLISRKKNNHNKTQKRTQSNEFNSQKVNSVLASIHNNKPDDDDNVGNYNPKGIGAPVLQEYKPLNPMNPPESMRSMKEGMHNKDDGDGLVPKPVDDAELELQELQSNFMNDAQVRDYYRKLVPNHNHSQKNEANKNYYPLNQIQGFSNGSQDTNNNNNNNNNQVLIDKLNYMINLLEEQKDEKTNNVTEEVVLYSFLGIFIIFVVDSFARVGKYVR
jgi:hypothetical protein